MREYEDGVVFAVKVQPKAKQSHVAGVQEGLLRIKVTAPPVEGAANEALKKVLSRFLHKPKTNIEIVKGKTAHRKLVHCRDLTPGELKRIVEQALGRS